MLANNCAILISKVICFIHTMIVNVVSKILAIV